MLPISETIHTNIKAKSPGQFDDGRAYGYMVVDTAFKPEFMMRTNQMVVANGDMNIVLYEVGGGKNQVALVLTEEGLRREFDGVPD